MVIDNADKIPKKLTVTETKTRPDKKAIGDELKLGKTVAGARLDKRHNIQVR